MGENLLQKVLPKPLSKNFYYSFLIYGVLLHNPKLATMSLENIGEMAGKTLWKRVIPRTPFLNFL